MAVFIVHSGGEIPKIFVEKFHFMHGNEIPPTGADLILQWGEGNYSNQSGQGWVSNSKEGLQNANKSVWKDLLPLSGLLVGGEQEQYTKRFIVYVFHCKVLGIFSEKREALLLQSTLEKPQFGEVQLDHKSRILRKVKINAIRAIHSLGLDFGMVLLGIKNKEVYILQVSPKPRLIPALANRFGEAIQELEHHLLQPVPRDQIVLGADPEFVLRDPHGKFILASKYFSKDGEVGCDQIWMRGDRSKKRLPIVEIRPNPSTEPKTLVKNMYQNLLQASKAINNPDIQFLAGSAPLKGYPIGGHIHFSNIHLNSYLIRALDNYLALPLFLMEDPEGFIRRPKYGFLGDFREQFHGGFEYRTLPSWLVSPRVTKGVIALAKVIASSYTRLKRDPLSNPELQQAFYAGEQEVIRDVVRSLWWDLEGLEDYHTYRGYLDPLKESIFHFQRWKDTDDIRIRWRIPPFERKRIML